VELIDGELVYDAMTGFEHGDAQASIGGELKLRFRGSGPPGGAGGWWIATEVDVAYAHPGFAPRRLGLAQVPSRRASLGPRVTVRPDWVCEILSSNRNKDLVEKRRVLHEHGVSHYWIVDLEAPLLTVLRHHPDGYLIVATVAPGEPVRLEPFQEIELEVSRLLGDLG